MNLTSVTKNVKVTRDVASKFRLHGLINRFDMACPGPEVIFKDVPYAKALKMNNISDIYVFSLLSDWVYVRNNNSNLIEEIYSESVETKEESTVEVVQEEEPVVEEEIPVEEELDESDEEDESVETEENSEDVEEIEEVTENDETPQEIEKSATEDTVTESTETIQRVAAVPANDYNTSKHNNNYNKYNKKKK